MSEVQEPTTPTATDMASATPRSADAVVARLASIVALALLAALLVLLLGRDDGAGSDLAEGIRTNRVQAVYLVNDRVFFGNLEARSGDWLELQDAFYLRRTAAEEGRDGEEAATTDLVPIEQEVGGDGDMLVNAREIVLVQNLAADSAIAREIEDAVQ